MNKFHVQISYTGRSAKLDRSLSLLLGSPVYSGFDETTGERVLEYKLSTEMNILRLKEAAETTLFKEKQYFSVTIKDQR